MTYKAIALLWETLVIYIHSVGKWVMKRFAKRSIDCLLRLLSRGIRRLNRRLDRLWKRYHKTALGKRLSRIINTTSACNKRIARREELIRWLNSKREQLTESVRGTLYKQFQLEGY